MKVVLSGCTGYIGGGVLTQCLNHPSITSVLVLSRREIEGLAGNSKAKVIIVKDFTLYDEPTIKELRTADAAIWCLGTKTGDERVDIEYPLTFINVIKSRPSGSKAFRFIQLSGALTEPPPKEGEKERSLWFYANGRRVRGMTEVKVMETADDASPSEFTVNLVKPGGVFADDAGMARCILGDSMAIGMNALAPVMVDLALYGSDQKVFSNRDIIEYAKRLETKPKY